MHRTSIYFDRGWWYGRCICGWTSGAFESDLGASGACFTHEDSQLN